MKKIRILGFVAMAALAVAALCSAGPPIAAAAHTLSHPELRQSADGMRADAGLSATAASAAHEQAIQVAPASVRLAMLRTHDGVQPADRRRVHVMSAREIGGGSGDVSPISLLTEQPRPYPRT